MTPLLPPPLVGKVHCMDALELMRLIPAQSVDLLLTDPPYAVHEAEWDKPFDIQGFWVEAKRIIKPRGAIVLTCVMRLAWQLIAANPDWFKYDMVAFKSHATDFVNANNKPMRAHENVLVFSAGKTANGSVVKMNFYPQMQAGIAYTKMDYARSKANGVFGTKGRKAFSEDKLRVNNGQRFPTTVFKMQTQNINGNIHPNQKDIWAFDYLIRSFTQSGDIVVDPFVGSGTTAVAARNLNRRYIVGDSSAEYCKVAAKRLAQAYTLNMFETPLFRGDELYRPAGE